MKPERRREMTSETRDAIPEERGRAEAERREEEERIKLLRRLVDFSLSLIAQSSISMEEAQDLAEAVRQQARRLFPGKEETFELIYAPRFRRLISEKYGLH